MTTVANLLFPIMDNIVLISHTHREAPAWGTLKSRIEERQISRGEHPDTHPFVFENLTQLPAIIALQRERVREDKENNAPHVRQLRLVLDDMLGDMNHSKILDAVTTRGRPSGATLWSRRTRVFRRDFGCTSRGGTISGFSRKNLALLCSTSALV